MINKIVTTVCIFIAVVAVGYTIYLSKHKEPTIDNSVKNMVIAEAKIISKKIDKNGIEHTIIDETNNVLPRNLMSSNAGYDTAFVDSLIRQTDIQKKEIVSLTQINQSIQGKNLHSILVVDSLKRKVYEYTDKNLFVSYTPDSDANKTGVFNYKYNQNLNVIAYNRKKWILGADRNYMDISSNDPNSTINGVRTYSVPQQQSGLNIAVAAKTIYLPSSGHIGSGVQLRVRLGKFTATGSQLYFPQTQHWLPVLGAEYQFLNYSK